MDKAILKQINQIRKSRSRERDKLDKILLSIAAGTLSLSATFIGQSERLFMGKEYLFASWVFLIGGLFSILFGYIFAELHFKYFEHGIKNSLFSSIEEGENNWRNKVVDGLNWTGFFTILIGISFFVYFV